MKLIDVLRKECVVSGAQFSDKAEALREIAHLAKKSSILKDVADKEIFAGLQERESLGSTGFGKGIAIPHCRLKTSTDFVVGIITVPGGVDFEALDGKAVNLIIFIVGPDDKPNKHLRLLSSISQALLNPGSVKEMLAETTSEALTESFLRYTHAEIDTSGQTSKNLVHVIVQDENMFKDIIEALAVTETSSLVTIEAANTDAYLAKIPLFAGFWRDEPAKFSRIIVAVIDKKLTNETIRLIENITGNLNEKVGVIVTVQELFYASGSLGVQS